MKLVLENKIPFGLMLIFILLVNTSVFAQSNLNWQTPSPLVSKTLNESRSFRVLLPESYFSNPKKNYSLLLLLDGQKYGDLVSNNARFLENIGEIPEHIIVAINSTDRLRDYTPTDSPYWEGDGGGEVFLKFLETEFLPSIENNYRIKDKTRVIWGHSAAGLFTLHTMYAAPKLFDAHLVNDGSLDWDDKVSERFLKDFLEKKDLEKSFLYFNSSYMHHSDDPSLNYFCSMAQTLKDNAPNTLHWVYDPLPKETHSSIPLLGSIRSLRALYDGYKVSEEIMFKGLDAVKAHYDSIKHNIGAPEEIPESVLNELGYLFLGHSTDQAIESFELASYLYPSSENTWDSLSDAYLENESYKKALAAMEKCIDLATKQNSNNLEYFKSKRLEILDKIKE